MGRWEISNEVMNGFISDMLPKFCEFLEFDTDENKRDYKGFLTYIGSQGLINSGSFIVDITNLMIFFTDNDEFIFEFSEGDSQENFIVDFTKDGTNYTQTCVKLE
ncbi:hypothetical protein [Psychroflexus sp. MES1-P1E]|uniref:hypothetical protein n=1 Tax=Psychroflexus sp. MES1-P1E TaxID=2058320 RepID=UPI0011AE27C7|nr:hypothetical protein [Psychroflexus sp. MES1-P1E]